MTLNSFKDITFLWPDLSAFAAALGISYPSASAMRNRDSIDGVHFSRLVEQAGLIGHPEVTHELLCTIAASKRKPSTETGGTSAASST